MLQHAPLEALTAPTHRSHLHSGPRIIFLRMMSTAFFHMFFQYILTQMPM
jgi:hypothetical protein